MNEPIFHFAGDVFAAETQIPAGTRVPQHVHDHSHLSVLARGRVVLYRDGVSETHDAPAVLTLPAHVQHEVEALTDATWLCIWSQELGAGVFAKAVP